MKLKIAVVDGGFSHEAQISFLSAETAMNHLDKDRFESHRVRIVDNNWTYDPDGQNLPIDKNDFSVVVNGKKITFACAVIMIHGTPGEDGKLQAYFDLIDLPYTTCDQLTSTITFNKYYCNRILESYGFKCAKAVLMRTPEEYSDREIIDQLGIPCFVKPNDGGSSFGATPVNDPEKLRPSILQAFDHGKQVIVEEFMAGTEVTNGVYFNGSEVHALPITEIVTKNEFFDFKAKYEGESEEITPARISDQMTADIKVITRNIYEKLGLAGICRVDYIIKDGIPHVIEINTVPGQTSESLIPKMLGIEGVSLQSFFSTLIDNAIN